MGNRYNYQNFHVTSSFLPLLCRASIKDVRLPKCCDEPSSPRVGCMGQVKRSNKITAVAPPYTRSTSAKANNIKYTKLKRLFSGKYLIDTAAASTANSRNKEIVIVNISTRRRPKFSSNRIIDVAELDPPLPVVKKVEQPSGGRNEVNLWKRRCINGVALKRLEIQHSLSNCIMSGGGNITGN